MRRFLNNVYAFAYRNLTGSKPRASGWRKKRLRHLATNPRCVWCGQQAKTVHHRYPVHEYPWLELDETNFRSTCNKCHFSVMHLCDWSKFNDKLDEIIATLNDHGRRIELPIDL